MEYEFVKELSCVNMNMDKVISSVCCCYDNVIKILYVGKLRVITHPGACLHRAHWPNVT